MYYKGAKSDGLVERLNIDKIIYHVRGELDPLFQELGISLIEHMK